MDNRVQVGALVELFIKLPMVLKVLEQDQETFSTWKMRNVYLDKIDVVKRAVQNDLNDVKRLLFGKHRVRVTPLNSQEGMYSYLWQSRGNGQEVVQYSSEELKYMTKQVMSTYLNNTPPRIPDAKVRAWY